MVDDIGFTFPTNAADEWDGFNHSGIEHFAGNPYAAVGREVPQNVLDATAKAPAKIIISLIEVATADIPDVETLKDTIERCLPQAITGGDKARIFFENAKALLEKPKVKVLQIADYNTTGVKGPCSNGFPYYALLKASGQSKKPGETSIGSFGIGKFAPYSVSGLRTVFVSTVWENEDGWHQYVQGKAILMSHYSDTKETHQGVGFWGVKDRCQPVFDLDDIPYWLARTDDEDDYPDHAGTTISILGFDGAKGWQQQIACAISESFFGAINDGKLEVQIGEHTYLKKDTLRNIFSDEAIADAVKENLGEPEKFQNSRLFLNCLSGASVVEETTENLHLGRCVLKLMVEEGLPKRIAILRDGMLITTELDRLKRFGDFKEFVAVVECQSEKGNDLLKKMEPPKHDAFEPERLPTPADVRKGRIALRELGDWVRKMLKRHAQDSASAVTSVDELKDFFADEQGSGPNGGSQEKNPAGRIVIRLRQLPKPDRSSVAEPEGSDKFETPDNTMQTEEDEDLGVPSKDAGNSNNSASKAGGDGGNLVVQPPTGASSASKPQRSNTAHGRVALQNIRAVVLSPTKRRISFTADQTGIVRLAIQDSGADTNHKLNVFASSEGTISDGFIDDLKVVKGARGVVEVELDAEFAGTMRIVADAI